MKELNKCPYCGHVLVSHESVHALYGNLFCSRNCTVRHIACALMDIDNNLTHSKAIEEAKAIYDTKAEVVATEDVLAEDLQEIRICVTFTKIVKLPRNFSADKAKEVAEHLFNESIVTPDYDDHDEMYFECELVKN